MTETNKQKTENVTQKMYCWYQSTLNFEMKSLSQILTALQKDEPSRRQRLRGKLEQVIDTMSLAS